MSQTTPPKETPPPAQEPPSQTSTPSEIDSISQQVAQLTALQQALEAKEQALAEQAQRMEAEKELLSQQMAEVKGFAARLIAEQAKHQEEAQGLRYICQAALSAAKRAAGEVDEKVKDQFDTEIAALQQVIGPSDVIFSFEFRISDKSTTVIKAHQNIPIAFFTDPNMVAEARKNFDALLYAHVHRPLQVQVQSYINTFVTRDPLPERIPFVRIDEQQPTIPTPGSAATLSQRG